MRGVHPYDRGDRATKGLAASSYGPSPPAAARRRACRSLPASRPGARVPAGGPGPDAAPGADHAALSPPGLAGRYTAAAPGLGRAGVGRRFAAPGSPTFRAGRLQPAGRRGKRAARLPGASGKPTARRSGRLAADPAHLRLHGAGRGHPVRHRPALRPGHGQPDQFQWHSGRPGPESGVQARPAQRQRTEVPRATGRLAGRDRPPLLGVPRRPAGLEQPASPA